MSHETHELSDLHLEAISGGAKSGDKKDPKKPDLWSWVGPKQKADAENNARLSNLRA